MQIQRCKGCRDLTPWDMLRFRTVEAAFQESCKGWGYNEVRTPTLEYLYLFTSAGTLTPGMLRRVYSFLDWDGWSGERVVLKPDATIPVARLYIDRMAGEGKTTRLFYVTNIFVFEETGTKNRERWQCGAELIGINSAMADAELVAVSLDVLKRLGFENIELKLSHAGLMRELLASLGLSHHEQDGIFDRIMDGEIDVLDTAGAAKPEVVEGLKLLFGTKGNSSGFLKNMRALFAAHIPQTQTVLDGFIAVIDLIEAMGVKYQIDFTSGKGFEYYTGLIFRIYAGDENVGGGGRYDGLIPMMGGPEAPAAGFALYVDRLMSLIKTDNLLAPAGQRVSLDVEAEAIKDGMELADLLRRGGWIVSLALGERQSADYGWLVEVRKEEPRLVAINCANGQQTVCGSPVEVMATLGCG